jgi:predicted flap endonuclease-1-like 5' DNA nuclease
MYKTAKTLTVLGIGLSASAVVGWLLLRESKRDRGLPRVTIRSQYQAPEVEAVPHIVIPREALEEAEDDHAGAGDTSSDDLTQIRDIGPRFAEALKQIGITRFAQLAAQSPEALESQLAPLVNVRAQRIRANNWIGQAAHLASQRS